MKQSFFDPRFAHTVKNNRYNNEPLNLSDGWYQPQRWVSGEWPKVKRWRLPVKIGGRDEE